MRGFELPQLYLNAIESMRLRPAQEQNYEHYLDQVLLEYCGSKHPWKPSQRESLRPGYRSAYLDKLASYLGDDSKEISLDPNFNEFVRLNDQAWMDLLQKLRLEKQAEVDRYQLELSSSSSTKFDLSKITTDTLLQLAECHGYRPVGKVKSRDQTIALENFIAQPFKTGMKILDRKALENRGDVMIQYFFEDMPDKPFGLNSFVPGGYLYSEWNKSVSAIIFSLHVQCQFFRDLVDGVARIR